MQGNEPISADNLKAVVSSLGGGSSITRRSTSTATTRRSCRTR